MRKTFDFTRLIQYIIKETENKYYNIDDIAKYIKSNLEDIFTNGFYITVNNSGNLITITVSDNKDVFIHTQVEYIYDGDNNLVIDELKIYKCEFEC